MSTPSEVTVVSEIQSRSEVAIIILNWNGWRDTVECLELVQRLTYPKTERLVGILSNIGIQL
ncbi:MAG: hypothetical protein QHH75_12245 [Bacillota bacterium]|nr:hypothetical protein [Bacillota bacterium]